MGWLIETKCQKIKRVNVRAFREHKFGRNKLQPKIMHVNEK